MPVLLASSYSLAIVGFTSLLGASGKYKQGEVRTRIALLFSITSVVVVSIVRQFLVPIIPHDLFAVKGVPVEYAAFSMVAFSVLMVIAAVSMIRGRKCLEENEICHAVSLPALLLSSIAVGLVTGLLGAGGGFLIVPAMVFLFKLPMKEAVGTSLFIIAINSILGFSMDLSHFDINWVFLTTFTLIAAIGIFVGMMVSKKNPGAKTKSCIWMVCDGDWACDFIEGGGAVLFESHRDTGKKYYL